VESTRGVPSGNNDAGSAWGRGLEGMQPALTLVMTWPEPEGGTGVDTFTLLEGGNDLVVTSFLTVGERSSGYDQVYRRLA
jgi:hypothetical protein